MPLTPRKLIVALSAAALPFAAGAQTVIGTAQSSNGQHHNDLHWVNFAGADAAAISNTYEAEVPSGTPANPLTLTFGLAASGQPLAGLRRLHSFPGAALGYTGQYELPNTVLPGLRNARSLVRPVAPVTTTIELSSIELRNGQGWPLQFQWIVADAESTDHTEFINGTTDGGNWEILETLDGVPLVSPGDTRSEVTATLAGSTFGLANTRSGGYAPAYLLNTLNPGAVSVSYGGDSSGSGAQIVAFAIWPLMPEASIACSPASIAPGQASTCTVTVTNPPLAAFDIPVTTTANPSLNTSDCNRTLSFAAGPATATATCTITAHPGADPGAEVTATITASPGNYTLGTPSATVHTGAAPTPVPTLSTAAMALMGLLLGGLGIVRRRKA